MVLVVIIVVSVAEILFEIAAHPYLKEFHCNDDTYYDVIEASDVRDGYEDCISGSDESPDAEATEMYLWPDLIRGVGWSILICGLLGLFTKVIADGISIGMSLHHQDTEGSNNGALDIAASYQDIVISSSESQQNESPPPSQ